MEYELFVRQKKVRRKKCYQVTIIHSNFDELAEKEKKMVKTVADHQLRNISKRINIVKVGNLET